MKEQNQLERRYVRSARLLGASPADINRYAQNAQAIGPRTLFRTMDVWHVLWIVGLHRLKRGESLMPANLDAYCTDIWTQLKERSPDPIHYPNDTAELAALREAINTVFTGT